MKRPHMSTDNRPQIFQSLVQGMRGFIAGAVLTNQQLADKLGINATDYQVLNILDLRGSALPGELARLTGLTTGGVTVALDRLEKAGFVRRERNPRDRRSVIVRPVPAKMRRIMALYKPIVAAVQRLADEYDSKELAIVAGFFARANSTRENATRENAAGAGATRELSGSPRKG